MKTIQFIIIALLFGSRLFSQDTLYTTEGKMIAGKVLEVTPDEIKYKQASNLEGPTYIISKADVVLIEYKNGVKDVFPKTANANATNASQANTNNSAPQQVYVNPRPSVRVVVSPQPFYGWGWGAGWGYRPYGYRHGGYYGGGGYGGYHGGHGHHR